MLDEKVLMKKLLEFNKSEIKFKKIHENFSKEAVLKDFEQDYHQMMYNATKANSISTEKYWYSSIADFLYPRVLKQSKSMVMKNNRYHLPFLHVHEFYEFVYILQGECFQTINKDTYRSQQGELYYIAPGNVHSIYSRDDNSIVINILVTSKDMSHILAAFGDERNVFSDNISLIAESSPCSYIIMKDTDDFISSSVFRLLKLVYENDKFQEQFIISILTEIFAFCARDDLQITVNRNVVVNSMLLYEIFDFIRENYKTVTLKDLCNKFHFTPQYMSSLIKKRSGKTFKEILNGIKVNEACCLLVSTELRMIDIAYEVGFHSQEHFIRTFKSYTMVNPKEFRTMHNEKTSIKNEI